MFETEKRKNNFRSALGIAELIYHSTARQVRSGSRNAILGLFTNVIQTLILVGMFYIISSVFGLRSSAIRGDFILFLLSGVFLFMTHNRALKSIIGAEGPTSAMMQHAPMNTAIAITSSALSCLYLQFLSVLIVLFLVHVAWHPVEIYDPVGMFAMFVLSWISGVAVGLVFLAIRPWFPAVTTLGSSIYTRANMIASGKMFVVNTLPGSMRTLFDWNPLFHCIDQARGFTFINYNPHFTSISYPVKITIVLFVIGLMAEFYTRKHASASWDAAR
ncbi:MAG: ABC transporter permease [Litoreibacter sp.]